MPGGDGRRGGLGGLGRALFAVALAGLAAAIVRLRGTGGTPAHHGGWRLLSVEELRHGELGHGELGHGELGHNGGTPGSAPGSVDQAPDQL